MHVTKTSEFTRQVTEIDTDVDMNMNADTYIDADMDKDTDIDRTWTELQTISKQVGATESLAPKFYEVSSNNK